MAIFANNISVTYRELSHRVNVASYELNKYGIDVEQRIAVLLPDSIDLVVWFFAIMQVGAVALPLNTFANTALIEYYLKDSRSKLLITNDDFCQKHSALETSNKAGCLNHVIAIDDFDYAGGVEGQIFPVAMDDAAFWLYTSGSTGDPKGVVHRHMSMILCAQYYPVDILHITENDRCYSTSKIFFAYGLGNSIIFPFSVGASCALNHLNVSPDNIVGLIESYKPTFFFSVPAVYRLLINSNVISNKTLQQVKMCISAGEYLPVSVFEQWKSITGKNIYDGLGSTEAMHIFCSNREDACKPGTSGKAVSGYELNIINEDGSSVKDGEIGVLIVKGKTAAKEYWNKYDETKKIFRGDWLLTNDLYQKDAEGYYTYIGRNGDAFKSSGLWVSPVEIEQTLLSHEMVIDAAVISIQGKDGFFVPKAFVVVKEKYAKKKESDLVVEINSYLEDKLSKYKIPESIFVLENLPKTCTGKVARAELRNNTYS